MNKKNPANNLLRCLKLQVGSGVNHQCPAKMLLAAPLSFFGSSGSAVLQTKPSASFCSSQVREEVQIFGWSYCKQQNLEIVRH